MAEMHRSQAKAFLLMPFGAEWAWLHSLIVEAGQLAAVEVERADDIFEGGIIIEQIKQKIRDADAIVAVATGRNANVFYELGISESIHRPILVAERQEDLPFDVAHFRAQLYGGSSPSNNLETLKDRVAQALHETVGRHLTDVDEAMGRAVTTSQRATLTGVAIGAWLPNGRFPAVAPDDHAFVARFVMLTPIAESISRFEDDARIALREAVQWSGLHEWLVGQMAVWSLPYQDQWEPRGPLNSSRGIALSWRALDYDRISPLSARCLLLLPGTWTPTGMMTQLFDVVLQPQALYEKRAQDPASGLLLRLPLFRLAALLNAGIRTSGGQIPDRLDASLQRETPRRRVPGCLLYCWPENIDYYVDFGAMRIEGKDPGHGANLEPPQGLDPSQDEARMSIVNDWLHQILADEGFSEVKSMLRKV